MLVHHVNRVPIVTMVTPYQMSQELDFITSTRDCEPTHTYTHIHTPHTHIHTPHTHTHTHTHTTNTTNTHSHPGIHSRLCDRGSGGGCPHASSSEKIATGCM